MLFAVKNLLIVLFVLKTVTTTTSGALSAQCAAELDAIDINAALKEARPTLECDFGGRQDSCPFDFKQLNDEFATTCRSIGGNFQERNTTRNCIFSTSYGVKKADLVLFNGPDCVGTSCNATELEDHYYGKLPSIKQNFAEVNFLCSLGSSGRSVGNVVLALGLVCLSSVAASFY